ncbi:serine/threonine-protein kinase [Occultella gossypii]|uniref:Protein kinase n=1 Tax=Occultella gossypii TaxID=2800820 RepID=A0ABS7SAN3_9MICO|nr:serine/threonine-protein kinase [Occultella gossypii]MBZ2197157.1 protein kinase [Occultella gossypii]
MDERPASSPLREVGGYRLLARLGAGGMGTVYKALDAEDRLVAVKLLHPVFSADEAARERLRREVATLHRVRGEHVARVLDAEADSDEAFIVTELIDGQSLEDSIVEHGPMDAEELAGLANGLAQALEEIHAAGVVHRDLKPANVMLTDDGPVVIDFGISQLADDTRLTQTGMVTGTPGYVDPEVMRGADPGSAGDWWGWSAVLVYSATGRPPFGRGPGVLMRVEAGRADVAGLHPRVAQVLRRALHPDPDRRMGTDTVLRALTDHAEGREVTSLLAPGDWDEADAGLDGGGSAGADGAGSAGDDGYGAAGYDGDAYDGGGSAGQSPAARAVGAAGVLGAAGALGAAGGAAAGELPRSYPPAGGVAGAGQGPPSYSPTGPGTTALGEELPTYRPPSGHPPSYAPSAGSGAESDADGPRGPRDPQPGDRPATAVMPLALREQYPPTQASPMREAHPTAPSMPQQPIPQQHVAQQYPAPPPSQVAGPPSRPTPSETSWYPTTSGEPPNEPGHPGQPGQPGQGEAPGQWPAWAIPAKPRPGVTGAWWLAAVGLGVLWPSWTLLVFLAVFLLVGTVGSAARSLRGRRIRRGPGKWDLVTAGLASPWHLVLSTLLTLPGLIVAGLGGVIVWGLASPSVPLTFVVPAVVAVVTLLLWWTPSSGHAREGARSVLAVFAPGVRGAWAWVAIALGLLATAAVLLLLGSPGADWAPFDQPPIPRF